MLPGPTPRLIIHQGTLTVAGSSRQVVYSMPRRRAVDRWRTLAPALAAGAAEKGERKPMVATSAGPAITGRPRVGSDGDCERVAGATEPSGCALRSGCRPRPSTRY